MPLAKRLEWFKTETVTVPNLKDRGWTETAIEKFLGEPDELADNPMYKSGAPMRLYYRYRADRVERTEEWQEWRERSARRCKSALRAVKSKEDRLRAEIDAWNPRVAVWTEAQVVAAACESYNARNQHKDIRAYPETSDTGFLKRITVNFIRHELTNYDVKFMGRVGITSQHSAVRDRVLWAIADAYPWLEDECLSQMGRSRE